MTKRVICIFVLIMTGPVLAAEKPRIAVRPDVVQQQQQAVTADAVAPASPAPPEPTPPPGCGDVVYQYVPGTIEELNLEQLQAANDNLKLAAQVLATDPVADDLSLDQQLALRSLAVLEALAQFCGDESDCAEAFAQ